MPTKHPLQLLDPSALWAMESDFHDVEPVRTFVCDFIDIWQDRYARLLDSFAHRDRSTALEVLMGIKVSSVMIGAIQLRAIAEQIELPLRKGATSVPEGMVRDLHDCGEQTIRQLKCTYLKGGPP